MQLTNNQIEEITLLYQAQKHRISEGVEGAAQVAKAISLVIDQPFSKGVEILAGLQEAEHAVLDGLETSAKPYQRN